MLTLVLPVQPAQLMLVTRRLSSAATKVESMNVSPPAGPVTLDDTTPVQRSCLAVYLANKGKRAVPDQCHPSQRVTHGACYFKDRDSR